MQSVIFTQMERLLDEVVGKQAHEEFSLGSLGCVRLFIDHVLRSLEQVSHQSGLSLSISVCQV